MEIDIIRRVISEIKFKIKREIPITRLDVENYITILESLEKQVPKRVQDKTSVCIVSLEGICSACGYGHISTVYGHRYCPECGQRIDWS